MKNSVATLDNDMFVVCAIKEFLEWVTASNPFPQTLMQKSLNDIRNIASMAQEFQEMYFELLKQQIIR